jgi:hypothetical protein
VVSIPVYDIWKANKLQLHLSGCMRVPQIFYKFKSHLQILGVKKVARNKFHTGMTCKNHCYLVFLAQNIYNDTHFYMYWKKLQDYIDSIRCHQSKWDLCNCGLHSSNSRGLGMCEGFLACSLSNLSPQQTALSECRWRRAFRYGE